MAYNRRSDDEKRLVTSCILTTTFDQTTDQIKVCEWHVAAINEGYTSIHLFENTEEYIAWLTDFIN